MDTKRRVTLITLLLLTLAMPRRPQNARRRRIQHLISV
jgi:hypothetical protein